MSGFFGRLTSAFGKFSHDKIARDIIKDGYKIVSADGGDVDRVLELMRRTFFKEEPSIVGCGVKLKNLSESFQRNLVGDLSNGKSLLAVGTGDRLLGACVSQDLLPTTGQSLQKMADGAKDPCVAKMLRFWAYVVKKSGLPESLGVSSLWEVLYLSTHPSARGLGVAKELTVASRELASEFGFPAMVVVCTSEYSASMCRALRMRRHLDIPYAEYRDAGGRQIVTPPPPHLRVSIYVDDLNSGRSSTKKPSYKPDSYFPFLPIF